MTGLFRMVMRDALNEPEFWTLKEPARESISYCIIKGDST